MSLLTETTNYDEPGAWGRASNGWPQISGDEAYDMYVFANCVQSVPYGSYVLMARRGRYGASQSILRVHSEHIDKLKKDFERAGSPDVDTSIARREKYGKANRWGNKEAAPLWTAVDPVLAKQESAPDGAEDWRDAYWNLRRYAESLGIDTTTYFGSAPVDRTQENQDD